MKREDEYYEKWLNKLRTMQPILNQPDELTAAIMQKVSREVKQEQTSTKKRRILFVGSWMSTVAAGLLVCLWVGEMFFLPVPTSMEKEGLFTRKTISLSLPDHWEEMSRIEKSRYVSSVCRHKELQRTRKERILENRVKNQTKISKL